MRVSPCRCGKEGNMLRCKFNVLLKIGIVGGIYEVWCRVTLLLLVWSLAHRVAELCAVRFCVDLVEPCHQGKESRKIGRWLGAG